MLEESQQINNLDFGAIGIENFDEKKEFLKTMTEVTEILFERAMTQGDVWLAFVQVRESHKSCLSHYLDMRSRLIDYIDQLLIKNDSELVDEYKVFLRSIVKELKAVTHAGRFTTPPREKLDPKVPPDQDPEHLQLLKDVTLPLFEAMISRREVGWAYWHLKNAYVLGLEKYLVMKSRFLELVESELVKDDKQIGVEYKQRLMEWRQCLLDECWAQETKAAH